MALVFLLIVSSTFCQSMSPFSSVSTKTGLAPTNIIARVVAVAESGVVMTSSPFLIPRAIKAIWIASRPLATPTTNLLPRYLAKLFSNFFTSSPKINEPDFKTLAIAVSISVW